MDDKKREEIALKRYGLITPFLMTEQEDWGVKGELLKRISAESSKGESTIRRYLHLFKAKGFDGLKPKTREDMGRSHKISGEILEKAFQLKKEEPARSARKIIHIMETHGMVKPGLLKKSTLYEHFKRNDLTYKKLKKSRKTFRSFEAEHPNQIWQSDVMYGPYLPDPDQPGKSKRTYLVAIIDDYSRLVVHGEFFWHERLPHLENTLYKAIIKRGIPKVFYVDNGSIYSANQINVICAELGIRKISCRPYSPEGKGKIERFFRTVRDDFLSELIHEKVNQLHKLNNKFWSWLEVEYHQRAHSTTKQTPGLRWKENIGNHLRKIDERQLQQIFLWRKDRKVDKLGQISVLGLKYEVPSFLVDKTVEVRYNHFNLDEVFIYLDGQPICKAKQFNLSRWNQNKKREENKSTEKPTTGIQHLSFLEEEYHKKRRHQAKVILGKSKQESHFSFVKFSKVMAEVLKRKVEDLHPNELEELKKVWECYGPLKPPLIHTALGKAIIRKGYDQHISYYLECIVKTHLKNRKDTES